MTDVNKIKSAISNRGGIAQPCHYVLTITPPIMLTENKINSFVGNLLAGNLLDAAVGGLRTAAQMHVMNQSKHVSLLAESCSIPGRQMLTTEHRIFGTVRKMPYGVLYDDFTVTFMCTNSMVERIFFDSWQQFIMSSGSQYMEYYDNYVGSIMIQKMDIHRSIKKEKDDNGKIKSVKVTRPEYDDTTTKLGKAFSGWKLYEVYPVSIQAQELSYGDTEYLRLTVQFSYARWQTLTDKLLSESPNLPWIGDESTITPPDDIAAPGAPDEPQRIPEQPAGPGLPPTPVPPVPGPTPTPGPPGGATPTPSVPDTPVAPVPGPTPGPNPDPTPPPTPTPTPSPS